MQTNQLHNLVRLLRREQHVCPWWLAYTFDNPLRGLLHQPAQILDGLVGQGDTVIDMGCGIGFFSLGLARIVGAAGHVLAIDRQQRMLTILRQRARHASLERRISPICCSAEHLPVTRQVDMVLVFWMAHEVPNQHDMFAALATLLKSGGKLLLAEPNMHVSRNQYQHIFQQAHTTGLQPIPGPAIGFSRSALFLKP
jgi:ubiquinone/menaquinone biosynthesis C-methylase UbiE